MALDLIYLHGITKGPPPNGKKLTTIILEAALPLISNIELMAYSVEYESVLDNSWGAKLRRWAAQLLLKRYIGGAGLALVDGLVTDLLWDILDLWLFPNIRKRAVQKVKKNLRHHARIGREFKNSKAVLICHSAGSVVITSALAEMPDIAEYVSKVVFIGSPFGSTLPPVRGLTKKVFEDDLRQALTHGGLKQGELWNVYSTADMIAGPFKDLLIPVRNIESAPAHPHTDLKSYLNTTFKVLAQDLKNDQK